MINKTDLNPVRDDIIIEMGFYKIAVNPVRDDIINNIKYYGV